MAHIGGAAPDKNLWQPAGAEEPVQYDPKNPDHPQSTGQGAGWSDGAAPGHNGGFVGAWLVGQIGDRVDRSLRYPAFSYSIGRKDFPGYFDGNEPVKGVSGTAEVSRFGHGNAGQCNIVNQQEHRKPIVLHGEGSGGQFVKPPVGTAFKSRVTPHGFIGSEGYCLSQIPPDITPSPPFTMKPKHPFHHLLVALLGMAFLLLSSAVHAQDQDKDEKAADVAAAKEAEEQNGKARRAKETAERAKEATEVAKTTKETKKEVGNARRAKETAERTKETAERAKEAAEVAKTTKETKEEVGNAKRAKEAAERAKKSAEQAKEASAQKERADESEQKDGKPAAPEKGPEPTPQPPKPEAPGESEADATPDSDTPARGQGRRETTPGTRERTERRPAREPSEVRERRERPATPVSPLAPPADESKPPVDMPVVPSEPPKPREETKPRGDDAVPAKEKETPEDAPVKPEDRESAKIPATEPERLAESEVAEVTREVQRELDQRKTRIESREEAQALIDEILGAESRISRAEIARQEQFRPRFERQRPGEERLPEVSSDQHRAATTYFQRRLRGREVEGPPPEFFGRSEYRGDRTAHRVEDRVVERVEFVRPRYLNEGRRYVHFDSRAAIPAILMAAQAMNQVRFQPTREIAPIFYERQDVSATHAMPLPPENYRSENSWVVSYPVDENSMISSGDILFLQGSTQFSDPYSYEIVSALADAMKEMPEEERFVIEGHASAEGSYDSNMVLSQQRAEHIVREIVRRGVSPYRLLPVGYGESEARRPADAAEALRSQDRRVVVFRMKR